MRWPGDCVDSFGKFVGFCRIVTRQARVSKPAYTRRVCPPDDGHRRRQRVSAFRAAIPHNHRRVVMETALTLEQEKNPWESQAARFNIAAEKLNLDPGLWRVLQQPNR